MITLTLGSWLTGILATLFIILCLFMVLVILIQKPRGGGLAGAFGGAGGGQSAVFGAKTGDVLTWFTIVFFVLFILLAMALVYTTRDDNAAAVPVIEAPADDASPVPADLPPLENRPQLPPINAGAPESPLPALPPAPPAPPAPAAPETPAPAAPAAPAPAPAPASATPQP
jgi:preprotein translocase subunit SecG